MQIKINEKILSIPPYISTHWSRVATLHTKGNSLTVTLVDGETIHISGLQTDTIEMIFNYHAAYLQNSVSPSAPTSTPTSLQNKMDAINGLLDQLGNPPIRLAFGTLDGLNTAMQHNPSQANAPDLPSELLQKISAISKIVAPEEELYLKAEPSCNCFYCQIARAINSATHQIEEPHGEIQEEEVKEEELQFQQWTIMQTGDKLFSVTNRLDNHEKYSVYLGQPVGCTCGKQGCEHILAVLKS